MNTSPATAHARANSAFSDRTRTGMHRLRPGAHGGVHHGADVQVAQRGLGRPEVHRDVGLGDVRAPASASLNTATLRTPSARSVRITRTAISPRLAISTVSNTAASPFVQVRCREW